MVRNINLKPKIAYVMTPITFGGAERVSLNFLQNVDRSQYDIDPILILRPWEENNIFVTELNNHSINYFSIPVAKSENSSVLRVIQCYYNLKNIIKNNHYDLIHTHGYLADILGYIIAQTSNIPIISTCHGFIHGDTKLSFYNRLDCFILKYFDKILSVSEPLKNDLKSKGINKEKISVIENAPLIRKKADNIEEKRHSLRKNVNVESNEILIGFIGRLSKEKGIVYLLESIAMLETLSQQVKLLIVGEGPQQDELNDMVKNRKLSSKVIFTGFQKNIDEWFMAIDIFVLPSLTEGTPMVLLEAMSYGVPCIATAVGGIPQIINSGFDGILVSPKEPKILCDAIYSLCVDPTKRNNMAMKAKEKMKKEYDSNQWTQKIVNEYMNVINNNKRENIRQI